MEYTDIFNNAEIYVAGLFTNADTSRLVYHLYDHTRKVVDFSSEIATHYNLIDTDQFVVRVAALFHDTGYLFADPDVHEEKSVEIMKAFMQSTGSNENVIGSIEDCIMATKLPSNPTNLLQQILADADSYNLGTKEFRHANEQSYKEQTNRHGFISRQDWIKKTIEFLDGHKYFTNYCKEKLQDRKEKNSTKLQKEWKQMSDDKPTAESETINAQSDADTKANEIQRILNNAATTITKQSEIADNKANMLVLINALIIPGILIVLLCKSVASIYLFIPVFILLLSSALAIVITIFLIKPKATKGVFTENDIPGKKTNLLFFGNFHKIPFESFKSAIKTMLHDGDYLQSSLIMEVHQSGIILARKHRLLHWAYTVFTMGIVLAVIAFAIVTLIRCGIFHVNL